MKKLNLEKMENVNGGADFDCWCRGDSSGTLGLFMDYPDMISAVFEMMHICEGLGFPTPECVELQFKM